MSAVSESCNWRNWRTGRRFGAALLALYCCLCTVAGPVLANERFTDWLAEFRTEALRFGIRADVFDRAFRGITPNYKLPDLALAKSGAKKPVRGQAEFVRPPQAYLSARTLARLTSEGRRLLVRHKAALAKIKQELGVAPEVVLAIWGRETAFGSYRLPHNAIRALATQAYVGRRKRVFRRELLYALRLIQNGIATKDRLRSSWAGAIGLTQFMPSEYFDLAYDLDRDGRKDIWAPADALASAANQLRQKGWERGRTWGFEVKLPANVTCAMDGPRDARTIADWAALGVVRTRGRQFPERYGDVVAFLFTPGGGAGPAFLVLENFMVFKRYNPSDLYALFVGHLADRIAGGGDFETPWRDIRQLRTAAIKQIQSHLKQSGLAISKVDGKIGANTRSQIGRYQQRHGLKVDCWPSQGLLQFMQRRSANDVCRRTSRSGVVVGSGMESFAHVVGEWREAALAAGVGQSTIAEALEGLTPDERVLQRVTAQAEHELSVADYIARLVSDERIATGARMCREHADLLHRIENHFGVPRYVLVAIWGIESNFGEAAGSFPVIRALATLAAGHERRQHFWREQLIAALAILDAGDIAAKRFVGSWAGAMGHTQFMPTTYSEHAVDFDGDGRRNIWTSIADALASAANYLRASGWNARLPWGGEVTIPTDFDFARYCDDEPRDAKVWRHAGVIIPEALLQACDDRTALALLLPAGGVGPAFLTTCNFDALLAYNASKAYALAVAHLADRVAGGGELAGQWPVETPLSLSERITLQRLLVAEGFDTGGVDGILGRMSRDAIRDYQLRCGLTSDGYHGRAVFEHISAAADGKSSSSGEGTREKSN